MDSLTLKRHNSFQTKNNRKATHSSAPRSLIFKLQLEVWKFNDLETNCLNLENQSFDNVSFFQ